VSYRFFLLALCATACHGHEAGEAAIPVVVAGTARVVRQPFPVVLRSLGTVAARPGRFAELSAPAPSRVARIRVVLGQRVAAGDTLVELDRAPFESAARSAEAAHLASDRAYARAARLVQAGILPQKDAEQAAADLAQSEAAALAARRTLDLATLRAPVSGVVTLMNAVLGASVDPSALLVAVADPQALDIVLTVAPAEAATLAVDDSLDLGSADGQLLGEGKITAVGAAVDSATRAVPVRARVLRSTRPLRIGEAVVARIVIADRQALTVPLSALVPVGDSFEVFVVDTGIARSRIVQVGARSETEAAILAGLDTGETVVTTGAYGVTDGARITAAHDQ
jgi:membrane fusion protein (multidrug efflux system)